MIATATSNSATVKPDDDLRLSDVICIPIFFLFGPNGNRFRVWNSGVLARCDAAIGDDAYCLADNEREDQHAVACQDILNPVNPDGVRQERTQAVAIRRAGHGPFDGVCRGEAAEQNQCRGCEPVARQAYEPADADERLGCWLEHRDWCGQCPGQYLPRVERLNKGFDVE